MSRNNSSGSFQETCESLLAILKHCTNASDDDITRRNETCSADTSNNNSTSPPLEQNDVVALAPLREWSDEIESSFNKLFASSTSSSSALKQECDTVEQSSNALQCHIISATCQILQNEKTERIENDTTIDGAFQKSLIRVRNDSKDVNQWKNRNDVDCSTTATELSFLLKKAKTTKKDEEEACHGGDVRRSTSADLVTELLRASKNLIRLYNGIMENNNGGRKPAKQDPLKRLKSRGMLELYLMFITTSNTTNNDLFSKTTNHQEENNNSGDGTMSMGDGLCRIASIVLFHAMRGDNQCLSTFVGNLNGIHILMEMMVRPNPVSIVLVISRLVHYFISVMPDAPRRMNVSLRSIMTNTTEQQRLDLLSVFVGTLAWTIRCDPPFPGSNSDRRTELAEEILRVLFAMRAVSGVGKQQQPSASSSNPPSFEEESMAQLGILLCDMLHLPNADIRVYNVKLNVVNLLMDAPSNYSNYLLVNGAVRPLLTVFRLQITSLVVEGSTPDGSNPALVVMPILVVLNKLAQANTQIKAMIKNEIFPAEHEDEFRTKAKHSLANAKQSSSSSSDHNMAPIDAPPGTLRWKIIRLMTWTESNTKRCASELLWTLCESNPEEFVLRTGFGNAVHMMGIKGLVKLPKDSTTTVDTIR